MMIVLRPIAVPTAQVVGLDPISVGSGATPPRLPGSLRDMFRPMRSKDEVRAEVWKAMEDQGVSRFPGAEGRIPNFAGAKLAAEKLASHRLWKRARVVKANPASTQTHARRLALEEGKTVIMAVPRLRAPHPFRVLDPKEMSKKAVQEAATIKGALKHGQIVALDDRREMNLLSC